MYGFYPWFRLCKLLAVCLYCTGSLGAAFSRTDEDTRRFVYYLGGPGFALTWIFGVMLTWLSGVKLFSWWIMGAMGLSFFQLHVLLYLAGVPARKNATSILFALFPIPICIGLMVFRPT